MRLSIDKAYSFFSLFINILITRSARGQTGKGANHTLFGGAIKAPCRGQTNRGWLSFPTSFSLVHFFCSSKRNEQ